MDLLLRIYFFLLKPVWSLKLRAKSMHVLFPEEMCESTEGWGGGGKKRTAAQCVSIFFSLSSSFPPSNCLHLSSTPTRSVFPLRRLRHLLSLSRAHTHTRAVVASLNNWRKTSFSILHWCSLTNFAWKVSFGGVLNNNNNKKRRTTHVGVCASRSWTLNAWLQSAQSSPLTSLLWTLWSHRIKDTSRNQKTCKAAFQGFLKVGQIKVAKCRFCESRFSWEPRSLFQLLILLISHLVRRPCAFAATGDLCC